MAEDPPTARTARRATTDPTPAPPRDERYRRIRRLGGGGQGEVVLAHDRVLDRQVALKVLHPELQAEPGGETAFLAEAQRVARLQHPNILPVYDWGHLPDGRAYCSMRPVQGSSVVARVRAEPTSTDTLRQRAEWVLRACDAVAFAHHAGILHRDLTPLNVLVGGYGEVLVIDWGVAIEQSRGGEGLPVGNPAWCPPEQARGEAATVRSDVFGLGTVLYQVLTGSAPWGSATTFGVAAHGEVDPVLGRASWPVPDELATLCDRCLAGTPTDRPGSADELGQEIRAWLEGARRRSRAEALVARADEQLPAILALRERAAGERERAAALLEALGRDAPVEDKHAAWALQDAAAEREARAVVQEVDYTQLLRAALTTFGDLRAADDRLADWHRAQHERAVDERRPAAAAQHEALLRTHDRGHHAAYLRGLAAFSIVTDPPARARLFRYQAEARRLVPVFVRDLGTTPVLEATAEHGSYVIELEAPGHDVVRYPLALDRGEHWDGCRPGEHAPYPIRLPPAGWLGDDERYVPAGWFVAGGDPLARDSLPRLRIWVDGFVVERFPVTMARFGRFLDALVQAGEEDLAERYLPWSGPTREVRHPLFDRGADGGHVPSALPSGAPRRPGWPVVSVDWHAMTAFAAAQASPARPWRLLHGLEREKAVRGVDARRYPWGDHYEAAWACNMDSHRGTPSLHDVRSYPTDESPYGIRGGTGNSRDWCLSAWSRSGPPDGTALEVRAAVGDELREVRGGAWTSGPTSSAPASRFGIPPDRRATVVGGRLACPIRW